MAQTKQAVAGAAGSGIPGLHMQPSFLRSVARFARRKPLGAISAAVILVLIICAVFAPWIAPNDPLAYSPGRQLQPPGSEFPLGSDEIGRDVLSRIVYGARVSLQVGIIAVAIGTTLGATLGIVSGYFGGKLDLLIQRIVDAMMAFPGLILALAVVAALGPAIHNVMVAIGILVAPGTARVVRSAVLTVKEIPFIEAAHALGVPTDRILVRHILPNVTAPLIVLATVQLGAAIITEASLSFLGLGTPPPAPSWGSMLGGTARFRLEQAPWLLWAPAISISLVVLSFNLLGDALRDVLDPRLRGGR
ncbi:MAG: ABC transporter permease [Dehalococcoidia bacterium]